MTSVIRTGSFGSSSIIIVVKRCFLGSNNVLNQIISSLVSNVSIFFQKDGVLTNFVSDFISGVFRILNTERNFCVKSACRRGLGVTITMMGGGGVVRGTIGGFMMWGMVGHGMVGYSMMWHMGMDSECKGERHQQGSDLKI